MNHKHFSDTFIWDEESRTLSLREISTLERLEMYWSLIFSLEFKENYINNYHQGDKSELNIELDNLKEQIKNNEFSECKNLDSKESIRRLILPNNIKEIGYRQFTQFSKLEEVTLPLDLECIAKKAFEYCRSLKYIEIPRGTTYIGHTAFSDTGIEKIVLYSGSKICFDMGCFSNCNNLKSIKIVEADGEIIIPWSNSISIQQAMQGLENGFNYEDYFAAFKKSAFNDRLKMLSFYLNNINNNEKIDNFFKSYNLKADFECFKFAIEENDEIFLDFLFSKNFLLVENIDKLLTISNNLGFTEITAKLLNYKFIKLGIGESKKNNLDIEKGTLINDEIFEVEYIGKNIILKKYKGFEKNVDIPNSINIIGSFAFDRMSMIETVKIPETVQKIKKEAFSNCSQLKSVEFPSSLKSIEPHSFYCCESLKKIDLSKTKIKRLYNSPFLGCHPTEVNLPESLTEIGIDAFSGCGFLEINIPISVKSIFSRAFQYCRYLEKIEIPDSVIEIGDEIFQNCESLIDIKLSKNVDKIPFWSFRECKSLVKISIPESVKKIGFVAFQDCTSLEEVEIKNPQIEIDKRAFEGCTKFHKVDELKKYMK